MKIELLYNTPLWVCSSAVRKCWASEDKSDTTFDEYETDYGYDVWVGDATTEQDSQVEAGTKDKALIERVGNKNKHSSTLEHLNYTFDIDGISRACLQELARHRHASLSVKSTRYTLKELNNEICLHPGEYLGSAEHGSDFNHKYNIASKYVVFTNNHTTNFRIMDALSMLQEDIQSGVSNDIAKYCIPEAYKTSLVWTINARSLQNFLSLRTDKSALWEIRDLANEIYTQLPEEHKYLFIDFVKEN